jgi:hypothetical protein
LRIGSDDINLHIKMQPVLCKLHRNPTGRHTSHHHQNPGIDMPIFNLDANARIYGLLILAALAQPALADSHSASHACASVPSPTQRLACYDQSYPPSAQTQEKMASIARDEFGLTTTPEQLRNPLADKTLDPDEIHEPLAGLEYSGGGRIFTLANGQVWIQSDSISSGQVSPGQIVRIRKAMFGSYMLVTPNGVALRVKRKK